MKTITPSEVHSLLKMLGTYIRHLTSHPDTLLGRILGCFAVKVSTARRVYAILQENVFSTQPFPRSVRMPAVAHSPHVHIFDLKVCITVFGPACCRVIVTVVDPARMCLCARAPLLTGWLLLVPVC